MRKLFIIIALWCSTPASAITYSIGWTGTGGYTLSGEFSFDDSLVGTGYIDETHLNALSFSVFLNGVSQGSASLGTFDGTNPLNFNFDTTTETFLVGGHTSSQFGQAWNFIGSTVGFASGTNAQLVSVNNHALGPESQVLLPNSTLVAAQVPLPASFALLLGSLFGFGLLATTRRRKRYHEPLIAVTA